jgi:hypothetical protein
MGHLIVHTGNLALTSRRQEQVEGLGYDAVGFTITLTQREHVEGEVE